MRRKKRLKYTLIGEGKKVNEHCEGKMNGDIQGNRKFLDGITKDREGKYREPSKK